ncbi:MAG: hypothetical protein OZ917_11880 [Candidatus Brocadiaceae bacterium]|nr:hypothetical protein [Candidatus Brocadiaceae bacterium]
MFSGYADVEDTDSVGRIDTLAPRVITVVNALSHNRACEAMGDPLLRTGIPVWPNGEETRTAYNKRMLRALSFFLNPQSE